MVRGLKVHQAKRKRYRNGCTLDMIIILSFIVISIALIDRSDIQNCIILNLR